MRAPSSFTFGSIVALVLAGCFIPPPPPGLVGCKKTSNCADGEICQSGLCVKPSDAGTANDAGGVDAGNDLDGGMGSCATDSDCALFPNTRCCAAAGKCYATVAIAAPCDCAHPCGVSDACVIGTCGAPATCRPGCFPGSATTNEPAQNCAPQNAVPTYCDALPSDERTSENQGGACFLGVNCSPTVSGSCPDLPANRTLPPGANNPLVPQTCTPAAPTTNICYPAGSIPLWSTGCNVTCGLSGDPDVTTNCAQGALCVTQENDEGMAIGPSECRKQCENPSTSAVANSDCPANRPYCEATLAAGGVQFQTGVCAEAPCLTDSDCSGFPATPCCNSLSICTTYASGSSGACSSP